MKLTIKTSNIKTRVTWGFNPATRVVKSKRAYNRKKVKQNLIKELKSY